MKRIIFTGCFLIFSLMGCDSILEESPESFISPQNFYKSESDALAAVNGVYALLNSDGQYKNAFWWPSDMSADDVRAGDGVGNAAILQIDQYTHGPVNNRLELFWQGSYTGINRANGVISRVPAIAMNQVRRDRIVAEARFLRALFYFNLVRFFGDVPLDTSETASLTEELNLTRSSKDDVYKQIIEDLTLAENKLDPAYGPTDANIGRATQGAAKAMLAKVYLTRQDWQKAAAKAKEVIDMKRFELLPNYADVFKPANENNKESIFDAQFQSGLNGQGSTYFQFTAPRNTSQKPAVVITNGFGSIVPTQELVDSYRARDKRKTFSFINSYTFNGKTAQFDIPHMFKFFDEAIIGKTMNDSDVNYPILRYADLILMYAEALENGQ